jgi:hypothetical protein
MDQRDQIGCSTFSEPQQGMADTVGWRAGDGSGRRRRDDEWLKAKLVAYEDQRHAPSRFPLTRSFLNVVGLP